MVGSSVLFMKLVSLGIAKTTEREKRRITLAISCGDKPELRLERGMGVQKQKETEG
jgi:hypothetical protein